MGLVVALLLLLTAAIGEGREGATMTGCCETIPVGVTTRAADAAAVAFGCFFALPLLWSSHPYRNQMFKRVHRNNDW
jgi:hypothetical protein